MIYKLKQCDHRSLMKLGFYPDYECEKYTHRFPALKYKKTTTLWGEFSINPSMSKRITIDIYNTSGTKYRPWYFAEYGCYDVILEKIWKQVIRELKRVGAKIYDD